MILIKTILEFLFVLYIICDLICLIYFTTVKIYELITKRNIVFHEVQFSIAIYISFVPVLNFLMSVYILEYVLELNKNR